MSYRFRFAAACAVMLVVAPLALPAAAVANDEGQQATVPVPALAVVGFMQQSLSIMLVQTLVPIQLYTTLALYNNSMSCIPFHGGGGSLRVTAQRDR